MRISGWKLVIDYSVLDIFFNHKGHKEGIRLIDCFSDLLNGVHLITICQILKSRCIRLICTFELSKKFRFDNMEAIVIKSDAKSLKLIMEIAKRMGGKVATLDTEQLEDFTFGEMLKEAKTGKPVSRETIMQKLK